MSLRFWHLLSGLFFIHKTAYLCVLYIWKYIWKWSHSVVSNTLQHLRTVAYQAPASMGFSRQEYRSGLTFSFSRGYSRPRDQIWVSCIPGRRFNLWATREAQNKVSSDERNFHILRLFGLRMAWLELYATSTLCLQFSSVAQSCLTLCDSMNRSMPGLPLRHQLPKSTQTHVYWVADAIQPSHLLSSPSLPALNLSQHKDLFKWVSS